ncbi:hypothetical protein GUI51_09460 [Enterococcus mundtii]|uniref:ArpT n=1 Tax=Enterococcus mundtii TaxID=53346 RepID=A0ABQ0VEI0_ENTMU|nr:hypothetical protein [Enterococcus mundtii]GEN18810.1 hypothetical protein LAC02_20910 [Ligilactobacillus acidipiscis]AUB52015.1 hypothetical protein EM4838_03050 [Enterococcus mundtii]MZZ58359.1 hypothetical protein [Enterococcus mundtii]MZZ61335.1 hypothetical protein [Enterococcus mundtii]MZZ68319.1 hypothetical protein [Enterococcus mundtii]
MKLKDEFYTDAYGIGGLMIDLPTKNPIKQVESEIKVGDMVRCTAEEFNYPIRGYVERMYNHSAVIRIENTMDCDKELAKSKANVAVARLVDMEVIDN